MGGMRTFAQRSQMLHERPTPVALVSLSRVSQGVIKMEIEHRLAFVSQGLGATTKLTPLDLPGRRQIDLL